MLKTDETYKALLDKEALENTWEEKARTILEQLKNMNKYIVRNSLNMQIKSPGNFGDFYLIFSGEMIE